METRHVRGQTVNKHKDLRLLAQQWWVSSRNEDGSVDIEKSMQFYDAEYMQSAWHRKEKAMKEEKMTGSYGEAIGVFFGEDNLKRAIKRGDAKWVWKKWEDGTKEKQLEWRGSSGTHIYQCNLFPHLDFAFFYTDFCKIQ